MKKTILASLLWAGIINANAQVITDTVSIGASYANQVWYSLANDEQGTAPKNNWDVAFDASGYGSTILINSVNGVTLWKYQKSDTSGWAAIDTTGLSGWTPRWNSDTSWAYGAIGRYANPSDPYDLDWGKYNVTTHAVTGDSIYIIKLADGSYRKLVIQSLVSGVYNFKYANLDGSNTQTASFDKSLYSGKNFGYYSLQHNTALNREPNAANWDLVFGQYSALIPSGYTVTGVLSNSGVETALDSSVANTATYNNWSALTFYREINTIGYDWKTFGGTGYTIEDSTVYFVKPVNGDIWKVIMTGFGGSSNGNIIFSKEKVYTNTADVPGIPNAGSSAAIYPNPSAGQTVNVIYSFGTATEQAMITVYDMTGRAVLNGPLNGGKGLHQYLIHAGTLNPGMYIADITANGIHNQQKFIVQ